jgi:hypothetical protein
MLAAADCLADGVDVGWVDGLKPNLCPTAKQWILKVSATGVDGITLPTSAGSTVHLNSPGASDAVEAS